MSKQESREIFVEEFPDFKPLTKEDEKLFLIGLEFAKRFPEYTEPLKDDYHTRIRSIRINLPEPFRPVVVGKIYNLSGNERVYSTSISVGTPVEINVVVTSHELKKKGESYVRSHLATEIGLYF